MVNLINLSYEDLQYEITRDGWQGTLKRYQNHPLSSQVLLELFEEDGDDLGVQLFLAYYRNVPSQLLSELAEKASNEEVMAGIAAHHRSAPDVLAAMIEKGGARVRFALATHKQLPPSVARMLVDDPNPVVRAQLAMNPAVGRNLQHHLVQDRASIVRTALIERKNPDNDIVDVLMQSEDVWDRSAVVLSSHLGDEALFKAADLDNLEMQLGLFQRGGLSDRVLESLTMSHHGEVSRQALEIKALNETDLLVWAGNDDPALRKVVAAKDNLPGKVQDSLVCDVDFSVRETLAASASLAAGAFDYFLEQSDCLSTLAVNPHLTPSQIEKLCDIEDETIHKLLATRDDLDHLHLEILVNERMKFDVIYQLAKAGWRFRSISPEMTVRLADSKLPTLRAFAADSACIGELAVRFNLALDPAPSVKLRLVGNVSCGKDTLEVLAREEDEEILQAVERSLHHARAEAAAGGEVEPEQGDDQGRISGFVRKLINKVKR